MLPVPVSILITVPTLRGNVHDHFANNKLVIPSWGSGSTSQSEIYMKRAAIVQALACLVLPAFGQEKVEDGPTSEKAKKAYRGL